MEGPLSLVRRLPPTVQLLVAGTLVNKIGSFIVPFLSIVLAREFAVPEPTIGLLLLAYGAGSVLSILTGGLLTDRLGRRRTLLVSLAGSGSLAVAMAFAPSLPALATLLILFGFLADLYRPASSAIVSDLLPSRLRAVGYAALRMAINLGFALGMVVGGALADVSWRLLFVGDGATTLIFGLVVYAFIRETKPAVEKEAAAVAAASANPWGDGVFLLACLGSLLYSQVFFVDFTVLPLTITLSAGYPAIVYGLLLGLNGLLIALFEISIVDSLRPFRRLRVSALGVGVICVGVAATGLMMHWAWFLATILLWTLGEILMVPQQMSFVADWAPPDARGRYLSLYSATWSVAMAFGPALFLPLHVRLGEALFWPVVSALALPACLIALHLDRVADRPELLRGRCEESVPDVLLPAVAPEA
jgi:MFS family permease